MDLQNSRTEGRPAKNVFSKGPEYETSGKKKMDRGRAKLS